MMRSLVPWAQRSSAASPIPTFDIVDRLASEFFTRPLRQMTNTMTWPSIEIKSEKDQYSVVAELPGVNQENIVLELEDNVLILRGEREHSNSDNNYSELYYGKFERRLPLPKGVDANTAKATFKNGVLEVAFKQDENRQTIRKIEINK